MFVRLNISNLGQAGQGWSPYGLFSLQQRMMNDDRFAVDAGCHHFRPSRFKLLSGGYSRAGSLKSPV